MRYIEQHFHVATQVEDAYGPEISMQRRVLIEDPRTDIQRRSPMRLPVPAFAFEPWNQSMDGDQCSSPAASRHMLLSNAHEHLAMSFALPSRGWHCSNLELPQRDVRVRFVIMACC